MSRFGDNSDDSSESSIDISPLIDCVFILLIFFIVTTVFVEEPEVDVDKPVARTLEDLERTSILIAVTPPGDVVYAGRSVGVSGVQPMINRMVQKQTQQRKPPTPVIIQADSQAPSGVVVRVIEEAKLGGAVKVSLATKAGG